MPKASTKRVQCPDPNCQKIQKTRGEHYFVCDGCGLTFDIEPNRFEQGEKNSKHKQDSGQGSGGHKSERDVGKTGPQNSDSGEDTRKPPSDKVEGDSREREKLEFR